MSDIPDPQARERKRALDPVRAAEAARAIIETLRAQGDGQDGDLVADMVEGETDLFEIIDRLLGRIVEAQGYARGLGAQVDDLKARQARFEHRVEVDRALIEQAMMIADLPKVERGCATLSLASRPASLVIETEADIPAEFWTVGDPRLDRKALGAALKGGRAVAGARLDNAAPSLTVRIK